MNRLWKHLFFNLSSNMFLSLSLIILVILVSVAKCVEETRDPDLDLSLDELVQTLGYDGIETYEITTSDGYILETFRIKRKDADKLRPVLLVHPMTGCGDSFFARKNTSPPIFLANHDYDVWVYNGRGTKRSLRHARYNVSDKEFWNFSWQEHGLIDLPATIDFVLERNIHKKLVLVGHSAGSAVIFVTLAELPQYNEKVSLAFHWGVSIYHENCVGLFILSELCKLEQLLVVLSDFFDIHTLLPYPRTKEVVVEFCKLEMFKSICREGFRVFMESTELLDDEPDWSFFIDKAFCGGSIKEIIHFMQVGNSGKFAKFNYGAKKNLKIFNSTEPTIFNLKNVKSAQVLWCGDKDSYCSKSDVNRAIAELPNVVSTTFNGKPIYSHYDFLLGRDFDKYIFKDMLELMEKYSN